MVWDTPRLFRRLIQALDQPQQPLLAPHLPHGLGVVPLRNSARRLDGQIRDQFGSKTPVDLFGFSMGGVIGRIWLQELRPVGRAVFQCRQSTTRNSAQPIPRFLLAGQRT